MGKLIVKRYGTSLALKAADHTYVECGTGAKGWGCWGGKKNGNYFRDGSGSTIRANAIAQPNEKAGISCYLFNGVCHQASNRILQAANRSADGVRGYTLSVVAFGPYGRVKTLLQKCQAPLLEHAQVCGDLPECLTTESEGDQTSLQPDPKVLYDYRDSTYMLEIRSIYGRSSRNTDPSREDLFNLQMTLFSALLAHRARRSGVALDRRKQQSVIQARARFEEGRLDAEFEVAGADRGLEFATIFNELTYRFQDHVAEALDSREYEALLDLSREDRIVLADPEILKGAYEPRSGPRRPTP